MGGTKKKCSKCQTQKTKSHFADEHWEGEGDAIVCNDCLLDADDINEDQIQQQKLAEKSNIGQNSQENSTTFMLCATANGKWTKCEFIQHIPAMKSTVIKLVSKGETHAPTIVPSDSLIAFDAEKDGQAHGLEIASSDDASGDAAINHSKRTENLIESLTKTIATAITVNNSKDEGYAKLTYQNSTISKFEIPFPKNQDSFYIWFYGLSDFQSKNGGSKASADILFQRVLDSLKGQDQTAWQQHRSTEYQSFLKANSKIDGPDAMAEFSKTMDAIPQLQKFTIKRVVVRPKFSHFRRRFDNIRCFQNERPSDTLNRINTYMFQYESLQKVLNPHLTFKLANLGPRELNQIIQEVFIENNVDIGTLNNKARLKLAAKWPKLEQDHIKDVNDNKQLSNFHDAVKKFISTELDDLVRPMMDMDSADEKYKWKTHSEHASLFDIPMLSPNKPVNQRVSKRARSSDDHSWPQSKRVKVAESQRDAEERESEQKRSERRDAREREAESQSEEESEQETGLQQNPKKRSYLQHPESTNHRDNNEANRSRNQGKCQRGQNCRWWQDGNCWFEHDARRMMCWTCGQSGHSRVNCDSNTQQQTNGDQNDQPSRYNISKSNHDGVQPHNATAMMAQSGTQTTHITAKDLESIKSEISMIRQELQRQRPNHNLSLAIPPQPDESRLSRREQVQLHKLLAKRLL